MAKKSKSVYERIEEKLQSIKETEEALAKLNDELQELNLEKDALEMKLLLEAMKSKGFNIEEALAKLQSESVATEKPSKTKTKKSVDEIIEE